MHNGKAAVFKGKDEQWYLRLVGDNDETLMTSEGHKNRIDILAVWQRYFPSFTLTQIRNLPK